MGILKEAADLAERVRAQGYDCECRDGHAFLCRPKGESRVLVRFSAGYGLKYPGLALIRAEAELKRLGILPKDRNDEAPKVRRAKERKEKVAAITEEDRQRATTVVQMIRGVLADLGGDTASNRTVLAKMAADAAGRLPGVTQFGSKGLGKSKPFDVARVGMVSMLDAGSAATPESLDRWEAVMVDVRRQLEGRDNGGQPVEPDPMTDEGIMQVHDPAEQTRQCRAGCGAGHPNEDHSRAGGSGGAGGGSAAGGVEGGRGGAGRGEREAAQWRIVSVTRTVRRSPTRSRRRSRCRRRSTA